MGGIGSRWTEVGARVRSAGGDRLGWVGRELKMLSRRDGEAAAAIFLLGRSSFEFRTADPALFESAVVVFSPIALTDEQLQCSTNLVRSGAARGQRHDR